MTSAEWIALAALLVSIIALLVSARSMRHVRRSADASERSAAASENSASAAAATVELDRQRRHEELAPVFDVKNDASMLMQGIRYAGMWVKLLGPQDLDAIRVRFEPPATGEAFEVRRIIVGPYNSVLERGQETPSEFPLRRGERFPVLFERDDTATGRNPVRLRCDCRLAAHEPWTVMVEGLTPGKPQIV